MNGRRVKIIRSDPEYAWFHARGAEDRHAWADLGQRFKGIHELCHDPKDAPGILLNEGNACAAVHVGRRLGKSGCGYKVEKSYFTAEYAEGEWRELVGGQDGCWENEWGWIGVDNIFFNRQ
jgi:hypothetical protein